VVATRRNEPGSVFLASQGARWDSISPDVIGRAVQAVVAGNPPFTFQGERDYYWNDVNRPIPVYHFRFADGPATDVFASRTTGEVISRRTGFWRAFSPFLMVHSVAFSRSQLINTSVLYLMLASLTGLVTTGCWAWWRTR